MQVSRRAGGSRFPAASDRGDGGVYLPWGIAFADPSVGEFCLESVQYFEEEENGDN